MKTMSHTSAQRKLSHKGKAQKRDYYGSLRKGNFAGANTPKSAKRGLFYKAIDDRGRPAHMR